MFVFYSDIIKKISQVKAQKRLLNIFSHLFYLYFFKKINFLLKKSNIKQHDSND